MSRYTERRLLETHGLSREAVQSAKGGRVLDTCDASPCCSKQEGHAPQSGLLLSWAEGTGFPSTSSFVSLYGRSLLSSWSSRSFCYSNVLAVSSVALEYSVTATSPLCEQRGVSLPPK